MAQTEDDSLKKFRHRALCTICRDYLTRPKKMTKCCHVFCLECIKRYLESKRLVNFPPCPECRTPITKSVEEVNSLEPARAEEDIAALVRKYEICGICNEKENPSSRCADCRRLICQKCIPGHRLSNPHHTLEPIITTDEYSQPPARRVCDQHKEQPLDLFCIMCQHVLCSYCTTVIKYDHAKCADKYSEDQVIDRFSQGFLQDYIKSKRTREYSYKTRKVSQFVYIKDFSARSRNWISNVQTKLQASVSHLKEFRQELRRTEEELNVSEILGTRRQTITQAVERIQQAGEYLHLKCVNLLSEKTTDIEVATAILDLEQLCSWYFISEDDFSMTTLPLKLTTEVVEPFLEILRTVYSCSVHPVTTCDMFAGIISVKRPEKEPYQIQAVSHNSENNKAERGSEMDSVRAGLRQSFFKRNESFHNRAIFLDKGDNSEWQYHYLCNGARKEFCRRENPNCKLVEYTACRKNVGTGNLPMTQKATIHEFGPTAQALSPGSFYVDDGRGDPRICFCFGGPLDYRYGTSDNSLSYTTHFTYMFGRVLILPIQRSPQTNINTEAHTVYLRAIVGKSAPFSGLETLFIYYENDVQHIHTISVTTCMAKFNLVSNVHPQHQQNINCHVETDEMGLFSSCTVTSDKDEVLHSSFRTKLSTKTAPENFTTMSNSGALCHYSPVPVTSFEVDLLCTAKEGLYFVKRGLDIEEVDFNTLTIGRLTENDFEIRPETLFSVSQKQLGCSQIKDLKPLTIIENRNREIVVICAYENSNTKFVIISPDKRTEVLELVEVKYPSDISVSNASVIDLEMDPDGNVLYVLENKDGTKCSISTRFFMP